MARSRARRQGLRAGWNAVLATAVFFVLLAVLVSADRMPVVVPAAYAVLSMIAFAMYGADKSAARRGAWRTSESSLHMIAVVGGWPGALVARQVLRHKTVKQPFRTVFWLTVVANCGVLLWFVAASSR